MPADACTELSQLFYHLLFIGTTIATVISYCRVCIGDVYIRYEQNTDIYTRFSCLETSAIEVKL